MRADGEQRYSERLEHDGPRGGHEEHGADRRAAHPQQLLPVRHRPLADFQRLLSYEVHVRPGRRDRGEHDQRRRVGHDEERQDGGGEEEVVDLEVVQVFLDASGGLFFE